MKKQEEKDHKRRRFYKALEVPLEGKELIEYAFKGNDYVSCDIGYLLMTGNIQEKAVYELKQMPTYSVNSRNSTYDL